MLTAEIEKDGPASEARDERGRWTLGSVKSLANKMGVKVGEGPGEYTLRAPEGKTFNATEVGEHPYTYGEDSRHKTKQEAHQQMHADLRQGFEGEEPPLVWAKSHDKDDTGDNIYKLHYGDKTYKVYWDQGNSQWNTPEAIGVSGPGGTPVDFVAHTRDEVEQRIRNGEMDKKLAMLADLHRKYNETRRSAQKAEEESIYLTSSETEIPGSTVLALVLEKNAWHFHVSDHDSIVYKNLDSLDEVRIWSSGNWIRYSKDQSFMADGSGAQALAKELTGPRQMFGERLEKMVKDAVAKQIDARMAVYVERIEKSTAKPKRIRKHVIRDANHRVTDVIETQE